MEKRFKNQKIRIAFGESLKNPFQRVDRYEPNLEIKALELAKKLSGYLGAPTFEKTSTIGIDIEGRNGILKFQSTSVLFKIADRDCKADFSIPVNFKGDNRIWSKDFTGLKVWTTIEKIYASNCDSNKLFDFLGKHTDRFSIQEMDDDLPF